MRAIRFAPNPLNMTTWDTYRRKSKGWEADPPARIHSRVLFGSGRALTPEFVRTHSITHVINCAYNEHSPEWFRTAHPGRYTCLYANDTKDTNILEWYSKFEDTLLSYLRDPEAKNVYVHCQCGINRSGYLCLAFMCRRLSIPFERALHAILQQRPCALSNPAFHVQVFGFSKGP
jgi:hypothetical protein